MWLSGWGGGVGRDKDVADTSNYQVDIYYASNINIFKRNDGQLNVGAFNKKN